MYDIYELLDFEEAMDREEFINRKREGEEF